MEPAPELTWREGLAAILEQMADVRLALDFYAKGPEYTVVGAQNLDRQVMVLILAAEGLLSHLPEDGRKSCQLRDEVT